MHLFISDQRAFRDFREESSSGQKQTFSFFFPECFHTCSSHPHEKNDTQKSLCLEKETYLGMFFPFWKMGGKYKVDYLKKHN